MVIFIYLINDLKFLVKKTNYLFQFQLRQGLKTCPSFS